MILKFVGLVRLSHTIFALPFALASLFLASNGFPSLPLLIAIILAITFCRNSAMAFNRLVDAKIDAKNPRTKNRHIPKGILKPSHVIIFIFTNISLFIFVAYNLNPLCFILSFPILCVVCSYSYFKRFSYFSQFFLGLSLGISPVATCIATTGNASMTSVLLGTSLLFWVTGFDTIYATADYKFDRKNNLHSIVTKLGIKKALVLAQVCHLITFCLLLFLGIYTLPTIPYFVCLTFILVTLIYIHFYSTNRSLDSLNQLFFLANAFISLLVLTGVIGSIFLTF